MTQYIHSRNTTYSREIMWRGSVYEVESRYGELRVQRDGETVDWPSPGLQRRALNALDELYPDFSDVLRGLEPGVYDARHLNPPGGEDCVGLLVRQNGSLAWCDRFGAPVDTTFSAEELCA